MKNSSLGKLYLMIMVLFFGMVLFAQNDTKTSRRVGMDPLEGGLYANLIWDTLRKDFKIGDQKYWRYYCTTNFKWEGEELPEPFNNQDWDTAQFIMHYSFTICGDTSQFPNMVCKCGPIICQDSSASPPVDFYSDFRPNPDKNGKHWDVGGTIGFKMAQPTKAGFREVLRVGGGMAIILESMDPRENYFKMYEEPNFEIIFFNNGEKVDSLMVEHNPTLKVDTCFLYPR